MWAQIAPKRRIGSPLLEIRERLRRNENNHMLVRYHCERPQVISHHIFFVCRRECELATIEVPAAFRCAIGSKAAGPDGVMAGVGAKSEIDVVAQTVASVPFADQRTLCDRRCRCGAKHGAAANQKERTDVTLHRPNENELSHGWRRRARQTLKTVSLN
jgi:hypothetical protein